MKALVVSITMTLGLLSFGVHAQAPASAPAGSTGQCKDGTYSTADSKKGACRGHKGVKEWYSASETAPAAKSAPAATPKPAKKETAATPMAMPTGAAPAGATGLCNDGTYYSGENKKGACRGHKGVKTWYGATPAASTPAAAPTAAPAPATRASPAPAPMPAKTSTPAPAAMPTSAPKATTPSTPSAGGAGQVWVNSSTKVYHCPGDRYYGKTKAGEYMSESDAMAKGNRAAGGKRCSS